MDITRSDFDYLQEELNAILVERAFQARSLKLMTMHELGLAVLTSPLYEGNRAALLRDLAHVLPIGRTEFYAAIQFAEQHPDLEAFMSAHADKRLSWAQVKRSLLPANPAPRMPIDRRAAAGFSKAAIGTVWTERDHAHIKELLGYE